jgi:hypothetical protein
MESQLLATLIGKFGGEWAIANACAVCFGKPDDAIDCCRGNA